MSKKKKNITKYKNQNKNKKKKKKSKGYRKLTPAQDREVKRLIAEIYDVEEDEATGDLMIKELKHKSYEDLAEYLYQVDLDDEITEDYLNDLKEFRTSFVSSCEIIERSTGREFSLREKHDVAFAVDEFVRGKIGLISQEFIVKYMMLFKDSKFGHLKSELELMVKTLENSVGDIDTSSLGINELISLSLKTTETVDQYFKDRYGISWKDKEDLKFIDDEGESIDFEDISEDDIEFEDEKRLKRIYDSLSDRFFIVEDSECMFKFIDRFIESKVSKSKDFDEDKFIIDMGKYILNKTIRIDNYETGLSTLDSYEIVTLLIDKMNSDIGLYYSK